MRLCSIVVRDGACLIRSLLAERLLGSNKYQGFPVVKSRKDLTLLGDISRRDLKVAIGAA